MDRPVIKALRRLSARAFVGEDRAGFGFARILERAVSLERAVLAARQDEQRRAVAVEARDLQIAGVAADIGIDEACLGMRLFEAAIDQYIVEDHRHAERPDLERSIRSEEHTSELQSLMRTSYAVFCLKK